MLNAERSLIVAVVAMLAASSPLGTANATVDLLSHRAAYRLSLDPSANESLFSAVRGGLVMESEDTCSGWISNQRLGFVASVGDGTDFVYDFRYSTWESPDSTRLRFNIRSYDSGTLFEENRGEARLEGPGGAGRAAFSTPEGATLELPSGTLFPTAHLRQLIAAAQAGETVVSHAVFDGSGKEGLSRVTAVIGRAEIAEEPPVKDETRIWRMHLAFHSHLGADDMPDFVVGFRLSERGVLHDLVLDYGDLVLLGELETLEPLAAPGC